MVEFALLLPLLLLLLIGILELSILVLRYNTIASAAREGARYAIVHPNDIPAGGGVTESCASATNPVIQHACTLTGGLDLSQVQMTATRTSDIVRVAVTYTSGLVTGNFLGFGASVPMQTQATMQREQ